MTGKNPETINKSEIKQSNMQRGGFQMMGRVLSELLNCAHSGTSQEEESNEFIISVIDTNKETFERNRSDSCEVYTHT